MIVIVRGTGILCRWCGCRGDCWVMGLENFFFSFSEIYPWTEYENDTMKRLNLPIHGCFPCFAS